MYRASLHLLSFPTRRSSDLVLPEDRGFLSDDRTADHVGDLHGYPSASCSFSSAACVTTTRRVLITSRALDRKSTRLNSSHLATSYAVFCMKKNNNINSCFNN